MASFCCLSSICSLIEKDLASSGKVTIPNKLLSWNMEQNPPVDQFGNGYNATVVGAAISATRAKYGFYSATSNGLASSTIYLTSNPGNNITISSSGVTFTMWFYITGTVTTGDSKIFEVGGNDKFFIRIPNSTLTMWWCDRGAAFSFNANQWNFLVCTIDSGNNGACYLNNVLQTSWTDAGRWTTALNIFYVCRSTAGAHNSIKGNIDEFRCYTKVLSSQEMTAIYTNNDQ